MLAKAFRTTPEHIMWKVRLDRGLIYQHALLRAQDAWTVHPTETEPEPEATEADFERLLARDTEEET